MGATREAVVAEAFRTADVWEAVLGEAAFQVLERCSAMERVHLVREGVPPRLITLLADELAITRKRLYQVVGLPRSTGDRKIRKSQPLNTDQGERVLALAILIGQVERMLDESGDPDYPGGLDNFSAARWLGQWLSGPVEALGSRTPGELLDTAEGRRLVSRTLRQMQTGAYA